MIQLTNVTVSFGDKDLFRDITWNVGLNERVALVGPNGAGKTTLFRIALGLQQPSGGSRACSKRMRLGYLPQEELALSGRAVLAEAMTVFADRHAVLEEAEELSRLMASLPPADPELPASPQRSEVTRDEHRGSRESSRRFVSEQPYRTRQAEISVGSSRLRTGPDPMLATRDRGAAGGAAIKPGSCGRLAPMRPSPSRGLMGIAAETTPWAS